MATLTETAHLTRRLINLSLIIVVAVLVLRLAAGAAAGVWRSLFPPPPPTPTQAFGPLPLPNAQNNFATPSGQINYTMETADGTLPVLSTLARVYFMPRPGASFSSFEKMRKQATGLGFTEVPVRVGPTVWRFSDRDNPRRTLDIDEISGNFRLLYDFVSDQAVFDERNFSSQEAAVAEARGFFEGAGVMAEDFKAGTAAVTFYRFDAGALTPTTALANAEAIGVSLSRTNLETGNKGEKIPVVSPDARRGLLSLILSGSADRKKRILEARYFAAAVDAQNWATYPLIKSAEALALLKSGRAVFASLPAGAISNVSIRKVFLAYLDPYPSQSYLQPVVVFSDEKGFMAYVPAVRR